VNSFGSESTLRVGDSEYRIHRLDAMSGVADWRRLPYTVKVLLENLLRNEDGGQSVSADDIETLARWSPEADTEREISFMPARVLMQDFTGVPAVVDLAAMRDAIVELGGDPSKVNPLSRADLVIDHSVIAEVAGVPEAFRRNVEIEYERNGERYLFLRWGQRAFENFKVVPPGTGIVHQVNIEYLAGVVLGVDGTAYPDTLVGTDSHTPMVNGLGVLGWGVGGIEAEAAMLGQPIPMTVPKVVGVKLQGELPEGATATDLVLTITELLRRHGVVGEFVEFYGPGIHNVPLATRATIGNMSPEYGSTATMFPVDEETLRYLEFTGRSPEQMALVEAYAKEQGLWAAPGDPEPMFTEHLELDLSTVEPSLAGPARPQDRVSLSEAKAGFREALTRSLPESAGAEDRKPGVPSQELPLGSSPDVGSALSFPASDSPAATAAAHAENGGEPGLGEHHPEDGLGRPSKSVPVEMAGQQFVLDHGHVVLAAITSCTNTSNPSVMLAAGLLAKKAVEKGLRSQPWVKTSLAPGSQVVTDYYERSGLTPYLEKLGFHLVGYGCTTCIGNSGPLAPEVSKAIADGDLACVSVLSGNRNFEGRINPDVRMNYLASPPLVVAYALAGSMDVDLVNDPLGHDENGEPVYLRDVWPTSMEIEELIRESVTSEMFRSRYADVFSGDERWASLDIPEGDRFAWDADSTYVRRPSFLEGLPREPEPLGDVVGGRLLALLGDSVTTDHISPAGVIKTDSPAGRYLQEHGVSVGEFNSYGARRGNHEVMVRGTFANTRMRNKLVPGVEGGFTVHLPDGEQLSIYDAAMRYAEEGVPLVVVAGKEYGSGSSRDWAAKGTKMLGVRAVVAESYERIHRSNLIGMGVLPLQFLPGESAESHGLTGREEFEIRGLAEAGVGDQLTVRADDKEFRVLVRLDTPKEVEYLRHGGILPYVLRRLLSE
jgi:aconitate hydratase